MHPLSIHACRVIVSVAACTALIAAAQAQPSETKKQRPRHQARTQDQPLKQPSARRQPAGCPEFGPGFVRMPGSDSCIRFGGGVGIGVGAVP